MTALAPHSISMGDDINQWRKYITRQILSFLQRILFFSLAQPQNQLNLGQDTSIFNSTNIQPEPTSLKGGEFKKIKID